MQTLTPIAANAPVAPPAPVETVAPAAPEQAKPATDRRVKPKKIPAYNVVLLNDDDHSYEYVLLMLKAVFGFPFEKGYELALTVDITGRVLLLTTSKEHAELKRDQIHAYGKDRLIARCKGSMSAVIEPAEG
jgi:ATP-dependent Clp protease adaptor protein ClpS